MTAHDTISRADADAWARVEAILRTHCRNSCARFCGAARVATTHARPSPCGRCQAERMQHYREAAIYRIGSDLIALREGMIG